jgi:hypothetical protein
MKVNPTFWRAKPGRGSLRREGLATLPTLPLARLTLCGEETGLQVTALSLSFDSSLVLAFAAKPVPAPHSPMLSRPAVLARKHVRHADPPSSVGLR